MAKKKTKNKTAEKKKSTFSLFKNINPPKTAQDTIPYRNVYPNGMIEIEEGIYSKSYPLEDVTFKIATQEDQESIFLAYGDLLNSFSSDIHIQVTVNKKSINKEDFKKSVLIEQKRDGLEKYRNEYNTMLLDKIDKGKNNLVDEKYITISIPAENAKAAESRFSQLDTLITKSIAKIKSSQGNGTRSQVKPLTLEQRLQILYDIYNRNSKCPFDRRYKANNKNIKFFDMKKMASQNMTSKDLIAPDGITFERDYFRMGDTFARTLLVDNYPAFLNCEIISDIMDNTCNMVVSVHMDSLEQTDALKLLKNQMININANVVDAQKKASKNGYSAELISPDLQKAQTEAKKILDDVTGRNQKLFYVTAVVTHFADSLERLNEDTESIQSSIAKHLMQGRKLLYQQEVGFNSSLPLGLNMLKAKRLLTTESASVFIPYSSEELTQKGGMYYGLNAVSQNMILFNRLNSQNQNGVILGMPGSGKSFAAKREMINVFLNTNDDIIVIDPENEYSAVADAMGGESIKISPGTHIYLNPFDLDISRDDDENGDPITLKSDFISSLCEIAIGGKIGLSPTQKSIIDRCVRYVYGPYMEHMETIRDTGITCDVEACPTFNDFYDSLFMQPQPEAQEIATALERFVTGSLDTFAHRSNVEINNRFTVYNLRDIGTQMKEMGVNVCLNHAWNKIISNKKKGKRTWLYIDEFHIFADTESSAAFIRSIYKRARKWGGIPTGLTQNVEDLLRTPDTRSIVNNCSFVMMLNQSPIDRGELATMFNISTSQQDYITNVDSGQGLLYNGKSIIPFKDEFPDDTELYKVMTTKPDETT